MKAIVIQYLTENRREYTNWLNYKSLTNQSSAYYVAYHRYVD